MHFLFISYRDPVNLAYDCLDPQPKSDTKSPILLLHGLGGSKRVWSRLMALLVVQTKRRVRNFMFYQICFNPSSVTIVYDIFLFFYSYDRAFMSCYKQSPSQPYVGLGPTDNDICPSFNTIPKNLALHMHYMIR